MSVERVRAHEITEVVVRADDALSVDPRALFERARSVWGVRELVHEVALRDVKLRYREAALGFAWAVFMPILIVLSGVIFRLALMSGHGPASWMDMRGVVAKAVPWSFFAGTLSFATASLTGNATLVARVYFPREVLPVAAVVAQLADLAAGGAAAAIILVVMGVPLTPALFWVPVLLALLIVVTVAAALVLSCLNLFYRDVKYIVQVMLTFGIFFTPVFFDAARLGPVGARLVMLNPIAPLLEGLRLAIVDGHPLTRALVTPTGIVAWEPLYLLSPVIWGFGGVIAGLALFRRFELVFAERV